MCTYGQRRKCLSNIDAACDLVIFIVFLHVALLSITLYLSHTCDLFSYLFNFRDYLFPGENKKFHERILEHTSAFIESLETVIKRK